MAVDTGAYALGLVGHMPSGPGVVADELIAEIAQEFNKKVKTFLLTSETTAAGILAHHERTQTNTLQLVDAIPSEDYPVLKKALPAVDLVQVIHVLGEKSIEEALIAAEHVDYLLLDSGNPNLAVKELGGTGRTHDWAISKRIVTAAKVPVFLAGGLNANNVGTAIQQVRPFGLDLCSSVRTDGKLDPQKLKEFFSAVRAGAK